MHYYKNEGLSSSYNKNYISLHHVRRWKRCRWEAAIVAILSVVCALVFLSWYWLLLLILAALIYPADYGDGGKSPNPIGELWNNFDHIRCPRCQNFDTNHPIRDFKLKHQYYKSLPWKVGSFECPCCHKMVQVREDKPRYTIISPMKMILAIFILVDACVSLFLIYSGKVDVDLIILGCILSEIVLIFFYVYRYQRITMDPYHICVRHFGYIWGELRWSDVAVVHRETIKSGKEVLVISDSYQYKICKSGYLGKGDAICIPATGRNERIVKKFYGKSF